MVVHTRASRFRRKWLLALVGIPALGALWWAFRPEKLWINEKVNEPAPFTTSGEPQPILTGRFEGEGNQTSGRATLYKKAGGADLRLADFLTPGSAEAHVLLARSADDVKDGVDTLDCGLLKSNQGDQDYELPAATDPARYQVVVIYGARSGAVYGVAKLEPL